MISVVVPAYQEASSIQLTLKRLVGVLDTYFLAFEIIVVSDGSTDGTDAAARASEIRGLTVEHLPHNQGKGAALRHGFSMATGDPIAMLDGDLDLHPSTLVELLQIMEQTNADIVVGSKMHPRSTVVYPRARRVQSWGYRQLVRLLLGLDVTDTQTGAKLFRAAALRELLPEVTASGFTFDLELLAAAHDRGYAIAEGPVDLDYQFSSTVPIYAALSMGLQTIRLARRRRTMHRMGIDK